MEVRPSRGPHNSLQYAFRDTSRWRAAWNVVWLSASKACPWFGLKNWMVRRTGAQVGRHVSIGLGAQFDVLFPGRIAVHDDAIVGYNTTLLAHAYLHGSYQLGDVSVGKRAVIGANCTLLPGVTVGEGAVVGAMSLVNRDVPAGEFWAGVPARKVRGAEGTAAPAGRSAGATPASGTRSAIGLRRATKAKTGTRSR